VSRAAVLPMCFALVQALFLAPFQHVHADHDHPALVHSHVYHVSLRHDEHRGPLIDDIDEHATVQSLDAFTLAFAPSFIPFVLPQQQIVAAPAPVQYEAIEVVEACAHDPPTYDRSHPRAPPA
jgi:hypothetical protein